MLVLPTPTLGAPADRTRLSCSAPYPPGLLERASAPGPTWASLSMWPPGEGARGAVSPLLGQQSPQSPARTPGHLQACPRGTSAPVTVAPAGPFTHSRREFLETVILNQEHRRLIYACTMQLSTHTDTPGAVLHICTGTYAVSGEYLTPTTHSQVLISFRGSQAHLLTGLFLDPHQLTIHSCLYMHKSPGTLR